MKTTSLVERAVTHAAREDVRRDPKGEHAIIDENSSVSEIVAATRKMIAKAREMGHKVAADNLEYYLNGTRLDKRIDRNWLLRWRKIKVAEEKTKGYCENFIVDNLKNNYSMYKSSAQDVIFDLTDWFQSGIRYNNAGFSTEELFFASGDSDFRIYCPIKVIANRNKISISGKIEFCWWDYYDFHAGLGVYIPGFGRIPDAAMQKLVRCGIAAEYKLYCNWRRNLSAEFRPGDTQEQIHWNWGVAF